METSQDSSPVVVGRIWISIHHPGMDTGWQLDSDVLSEVAPHPAHKLPVGHVAVRPVIANENQKGPLLLQKTFMQITE